MATTRLQSMRYQISDEIEGPDGVRQSAYVPRLCLERIRSRQFEENGKTESGPFRTNNGGRNGKNDHAGHVICVCLRLGHLVFSFELLACMSCAPRPFEEDEEPLHAERTIGGRLQHLHHNRVVRMAINETVVQATVLPCNPRLSKSSAI